MTLNKRLILASASPRRRELLSGMGLDYIVDAADADEDFSGAPDETVMEISHRKAQAVADRHPDCLILGADTLVFQNGALGKPGTPEKAKEMLRKLSGAWHSVYTGVTILDTASGKLLQRSACTRVHFVRMSDEQIDAYANSGEPLDKAGAYGIQGMGGMYIDRIEGSYANVVGLPTCLVREMLEAMTD